jgi:hypothetical protein
MIFGNIFSPKKKRKKRGGGGLCHTMALPFNTKKNYLKAKEE